MFERLTHRDSKGDVWIKDAAHVDEQGQICMLSNRLAAYEDSGLSPEQVRELAKAKTDGRLVLPNDKLIVSMCAGARAIETNINRMGKVYVYDVYKGEPSIAYLEAARILREAAEKAIAEVVGE